MGMGESFRREIGREGGVDVGMGRAKQRRKMVGRGSELWAVWARAC